MPFNVKNKTIRVISPSSAYDSDNLMEVAEFLRKYGYEMKVSDLINPNNAVPYHANTDENRLKDLQDALLDEEVEVIWALQGGYGSTRLIPYLQDMQQPKQTRILIGFSDITSLHNFFYKKWGWYGIHGKTSGQHKDNYAKSYDLIFKLLEGECNISLGKLICLNQIEKDIEGTIVGGNLQVLSCSLGTFWQPDFSDKIVFFEDIGEKAYSIDRMLEHMNQAEMFKDVKAIIFGQFTDSDNASGENYVDFALQRFADSVDFPVFCSDAFGHIDVNLPIVIGGTSRIKSEDLCWQIVNSS